jgi:hypothetical protein
VAYASKEGIRAAKERARAYVDPIRAAAVCARCGAQPIEWHRDEHHARPHFRVAFLTAQGRTPQRIQEEIDRCIPLCRRCHMQEDGRAAALTASRPRQKGSVFPPKSCIQCGTETKPSWRGMCRRCYDHMRRGTDICADAYDGY